NGNDDLTTRFDQVHLNDPDPTGVVGHFLATPIVVLPLTGTGLPVPNATDGSVYYQAAFVPILFDTGATGHPIDVRTVVVDMTGSLVQKLVQEKGVREYGIQMKGVQKTNENLDALWIDNDLNETTVNTGIPAI